jgi:hypothetical protein
MRIVPFKPACNPAGQPMATASPGLAPGNENVRSAEQVPAGIKGKASVADAVK